MKFEIFRETVLTKNQGITCTGDYRWRLKARNGKVIACSGEGYKSQKHCEKMIAKINDGLKCPTIYI